MIDDEDLVKKIVQTLYDKKGFNIVSLDVRGVSNMTDYFIVAEGMVDRHVKALGDAVVEELQKVGIRPLRTEGMEAADWLLLDFGSIVVHLFIPALRARYAIERLWKDGQILDIDIKL